MPLQGLQIIDAVPFIGKDKAQEITSYLVEKFGKAQDARRTQIEGDYLKWMDNYAAKPLEAVRTSPWYRASNFIPQLIRMHVDILTARMVGIMFGTKPFWKLSSPMAQVPKEELEALQTWMEFESFNRMNLFDPVHSGIFRGFKTGTNIFKAYWKDLKSHSFNVVTGLGAPDSPMPTFKTIGKEGFCLEPIPFEDFYPYPITADCLGKVKIKYHRLRFDERDVKARRDSGAWDREACEQLLGGGNERPGAARDSQATQAGITLTPDVTFPFSVVECWFDYALADGNRYKLAAVINPCTDKMERALLRMYFNPDVRGEDPFVDQRPMPREDFFYGFSVPGLLEQAQEEQAQIHNHRRDANTISNNPFWKKKRLADVPNPSSDAWPGRVFELENMDDLDIMQFAGGYNAMIEEEAFLLELTNKYVGTSPAQQAMGAGILDGKRGVYSAQGTMAMLQQGSDRPDLYLKQLREPFHRIGTKMRRAWAQYGSTIPFEEWGQQGIYLASALMRPEPDNYDNVYFSIGASDGSANKEVDRTNLLLMSNTMAGYYQQLFQAVSTVAVLPDGHPLRETLLLVLDGAKDLADRLLYVFDIGDRNRLIPDVRQILGGNPGQPAAAQPGGIEQGGVSESGGAVSIPGLETLSRSIAQLPR